MASNWNGTPHIMVGLGSARKARENVQRDGLFSLNMVSSNMVWLADGLGTSYGTPEERAQLQYQLGRGEVLNVPIIEESKLIFECRVTKSLDMEAGAALFFGDIANILLDETLAGMKMNNMDLLALDPVVFAPNQYYKLGELLGPCDSWLEFYKNKV